jgi:hypothetical protein
MDMEKVLVVCHGMKNKNFKNDFAEDDFIPDSWKRLDFGIHMLDDAVMLLEVPKTA